MIGSIYCWGQGVAIDYARAMAAYKVDAKAGDAVSQYQVGMMYYKGYGVDKDYAQALPWLEKAAAQDYPAAVDTLADMYMGGLGGVTPSFRRARELCRRAIDLGHSRSVEHMQELNGLIQEVTSRVNSRSAAPSLVRDITHRTIAPLHPQHAPLVDKRVEIHGTSRADLNGKCGVATDFHIMDLKDRTTWRYTVELDGGEAFKLKRANVRAEGAAGGSGGGAAGAGKVKGSGKGPKKGRGGRK